MLTLVGHPRTGKRLWINQLLFLHLFPSLSHQSNTCPSTGPAGSKQPEFLARIFHESSWLQMQGAGQEAIVTLGRASGNAADAAESARLRDKDRGTALSLPRGPRRLQNLCCSRACPGKDIVARAGAFVECKAEGQKARGWGRATSREFLGPTSSQAENKTTSSTQLF